MQTIPRPATHVTTPDLRARRARELALIHSAVCWAKRQGLCCATCRDLNWTADYRERIAALVAEVA